MVDFIVVVFAVIVGGGYHPEMEKHTSGMQWLRKLFPSFVKICAKFYAVLVRQFVMLQFRVFGILFMALIVCFFKFNS